MSTSPRELLRRPRPAEDAPHGSIAGQAGLVTAGTVVQGLARFAYPVLIGNLLGTGVVGEVSSAISLSTLLALLWPTSAGNAASKYIGAMRGAGTPRRADAVARYLIGTVARACLVLAVLGVLLAWRAADLPWPLVVTTPLLVVGYSGYTFVRGIQFGCGRAAGAAAWDLITSVATLTLLLLVVLGRMEALLLVPLSLGYLAYTAVSLPRLRPRDPQEDDPPDPGAPDDVPEPDVTQLSDDVPESDLRAEDEPDAVAEPAAPLPFDGADGPDLPERLRREIAVFVRWGALSSVAAGGVLQLSMVLTRFGNWASPETVDQYAVALGLATPTAMLVGALYQVLFPSVSGAHAAGQTVAIHVRVDAATRALVLALTGTLGAIALAADPIVRIVYAAKDYPQAPSILRILVAAVLLANLGAPAVVHLSGTTAIGIRTVALTNVAAIVLAVGVIFALSPRLGVYGSAWGYLAGGTVISLVPVAIVWRRERMAWAGLWGRFAVGLAACVALVLVETRYVPATSSLVWWELAAAVGYLTGWVAWAWPDVQVVAAASPRVGRWLRRLDGPLR